MPERRRRFGIAVLLVAAAMATSACTAVPAVPAAGRSTSTPSARGTTTDAVEVPATIPDDPGWRADVALDACAPMGDGWTASGRVGNDARHRHDYEITVLFTSASATVIGIGTTTVRVAAGSEGTWQAGIALSSDTAVSVRCVIAGVA